MEKLIFVIASLAIFTGCGPSAEQIAAEEKRKQDSLDKEVQRRIDSTVKAHHENLELMAAFEKARQDSIAAAQDEAHRAAAQREEIRRYVIKLKGQLAAAESRLADLHQFKIGRTPQEKAAQISEMASYIEEIKHAIHEAEGELVAIH